MSFIKTFLVGSLLVAIIIGGVVIYNMPVQEAQLEYPEYEECSVCECEPETITKEVEKIVEVPVEKIVYQEVEIIKEVEKIVEVEVEKIIYQDRVVYQDKIVYQDRIIYREIPIEIYLPRQCPQCPECLQVATDPQLIDQMRLELESVIQQIIILTDQMDEEIKVVNSNPWLHEASRIARIADIQAKYAPTLNELYWQRQQIIDWLNSH